MYSRAADHLSGIDTSDSVRENHHVMAPHLQAGVVMLSAEINVETTPIDHNPSGAIEHKRLSRHAIEETRLPQRHHLWLRLRVCQTDFLDAVFHERDRIDPGGPF